METRAAWTILGGLTILWSTATAATDVITVAVSSLPLSQARAAILVDLDGDGDADLVATDATGVHVFRRDPQGFVAVGSPLAAIGGGGGVVAGDVDGNGAPDLLACSRTWKRKQVSSICRLLLNRGRLVFDDVTDAVGLAANRERAVPVLADYDGDLDLDVLLFGMAKRAPSRIFRNDREGDDLAFVATEGALPELGGARRIGILDTEGRGTTLYVARQGRPDALLVLGRDTERYADQATARGLGGASTGVGALAVADLDGDGTRDVVRYGPAGGLALLLQGRDGTFTDQTSATGLFVKERAVRALSAADVDRDGRVDLHIVRARGRSSLLLNRTAAAGATFLRFDEVATGTALDRPLRAAAAATHLEAATCDDAVDLLLASAGKPASLLGRFPDDSTGRTILVSGRGQVVRRGGCARGGAGADHLIGHRVQSVLEGMEGDDVLVAQGGLTVMDGGPGRDEFHAAGVTVIRLPVADIVRGEHIHCGDAEVWIDTPLTRRELEAAGVVLEHCFEPDSCAAEQFDPDEGIYCHGAHSHSRLVNAGQPPAYRLVKLVPELDVTAPTNDGFGTCSTNPDCCAIGLDVCRDAYGNFPSSGHTGKCYPSDFDGT
jgi:FG-GAP-like repeat